MQAATIYPSPRLETRAAPKLLAIGCMLLAGALLVHGMWIPVKAQVAQVLLERAWQRTVASGAAATEGPTLLSAAAPSRPWSWADTWPVARLKLPGARRSHIVLAGDSGQAMAFGPGLRGGHDLTIKERPELMISGHRDTHFAGLADVSAGQVLELQFPAEAPRRYRIQRVLIVHHDEAWRLPASSDSAQNLTLVTCYPFDAVMPGGPLRWVVQAERI